MNECKWIIFRRCGYDKEQSIKYWEIIYKRCKAHTWGNDWTVDQINEFKKYIDMLLPFRESSFLDVVREVFGEVEVIKDVRFDRKI
jgi:hypothetical protein|tara:strand:- start:134 stop:391 length:258 start_codon:yes stop_codon:yes gene_type:complete